MNEFSNVREIERHESVGFGEWKSHGVVHPIRSINSEDNLSTKPSVNIDVLRIMFVGTKPVDSSCVVEAEDTFLHVVFIV